MKVFVPDASAGFGAQPLFAQDCRLLPAQATHQAASRAAGQATGQAGCLAALAKPGLSKPALAKPALAKSGPSRTGQTEPAAPALLGQDGLGWHGLDADCPAQAGPGKASVGKASVGKASVGKADVAATAAGTALLALVLGFAGLSAGCPVQALASPAAGIAAAPAAMAEGPQVSGTARGHAQGQTQERTQGKAQGKAEGKAGDRAIEDALLEAARQRQERSPAAQAKAEPAGAADAAAGFGAGGSPAQGSDRRWQGQDGAAASPSGRQGPASPAPRSSQASRSSQDSLERLLKLAPDARSRRNASQNLRLKVVADTGATLAFQQGFQSRYRELMAACERRARDFERIFDFQKLILDGRVLPPVIRWTGRSVVVDSPTSATAADATYVIERPARIVAGAPDWREWLLVDAEPFEPDQTLLPRTGEERRAWQEAVKEGWTAGRVHAGDIFETAMARLEADYRGMLRFRMLVDAGLASAPVLAEGQVALSVMGERLSVNETTFRITLPASFAAAERQPLAGRPGQTALLPE